MLTAHRWILTRLRYLFVFVFCMYVIKPVDPSNLLINLKHNNMTVSRKEKLAYTSQTKRFLHLLKRHFYIYSLQRYTRHVPNLLSKQNFIRGFYETWHNLWLWNNSRANKKSLSYQNKQLQSEKLFYKQSYILQHNQQENIERKM